MIRDTGLTRTQKPTWVSLIYRTEPTTTKCENRKKTKKQKKIIYAQKYRSVLRGIHVVSPEEEKEGYGGKDLQKGEV